MTLCDGLQKLWERCDVVKILASLIFLQHRTLEAVYISLLKGGHDLVLIPPKKLESHWPPKLSYPLDFYAGKV